MVLSEVLILVLMEYALWGFKPVEDSEFFDSVLILVLMEYALWAMDVKPQTF